MFKARNMHILKSCREGGMITTVWRCCMCRAAAILGAQALSRGAHGGIWGPVRGHAVAAQVSAAGPYVAAPCLLWLLEEDEVLQLCSMSPASSCTFKHNATAVPVPC